MGGRDCKAVAAANECETIRALGEPNQVCSCSCLPADRVNMPETSILGGTGFVMRDLKTLLRGVAAKACLIGPQIFRQSKGADGFEALDECKKLSEEDFDPVRHFLAPRVPQGRLPLGCTHRGYGSSGAFGANSTGYEGIHPAAGAVMRLMDSKKNVVLLESGALSAAHAAADVRNVEMEIYMAREGDVLTHEQEQERVLMSPSVTSDSPSTPPPAATGSSNGDEGMVAPAGVEAAPSRPRCSTGSFFHRRTIEPRERWLGDPPAGVSSRRDRLVPSVISNLMSFVQLLLCACLVGAGEPCYSLGFTAKRVVEACVRCTPIQGQASLAPLQCTGSHDSRFAISKEVRAEARRQDPPQLYLELQKLCLPGHRLALAKDGDASNIADSAGAAGAQTDECVNEADSKCDFEGLMQSLIQYVRDPTPSFQSLTLTANFCWYGRLQPAKVVKLTARKSSGKGPSTRHETLSV